MDNSNSQGRRFGKSISHHNLQNMAMRYSERNYPILISGKDDHAIMASVREAFTVQELIKIFQLRTYHYQHPKRISGRCLAHLEQ